MRSFPLISEYITSILSPEEHFAALTYLRAVPDAANAPVMSVGNFAVVFKMQDKSTGRYYALKCFLKDQEGRAESYKLISDELEYVRSPYLIGVRYLEDELFVDSNNSPDREFPVVLMEWVEGKPLDAFIRENLDNPLSLHLLAYRFCQMASWMMMQPFAHGDLKSDNILVKEDGTITLVDYDGMFVPAMQGQKAREIGNHDFRHPERSENDFNERMDDFSLAVIALSLKAIANNPSYYTQFGAQDRLLFSENDYRNIQESNVFQTLFKSMNDIEQVRLTGLFCIALSEKNLSSVSFDLFNISHPSPEREPAILSKTFQRNDISLEMIFVESGVLDVVSHRPDDSDIVKKVDVDNFYMSRYLISQKLWSSVMGTNPSKQQGDALPVTNVSLQMCRDFCQKLSELFQVEFDLPTTVQWKYAAHGGRFSRHYTYIGSNIRSETGWFDTTELHPIGRKEPNELGLYDMAGNVFQWTRTKGPIGSSVCGGNGSLPTAGTTEDEVLKMDYQGSEDCGFRVIIDLL